MVCIFSTGICDSHTNAYYKVAILWSLEAQSMDCGHQQYNETHYWYVVHISKVCLWVLVLVCSRVLVLVSSNRDINMIHSFISQYIPNILEILPATFSSLCGSSGIVSLHSVTVSPGAKKNYSLFKCPTFNRNYHINIAKSGI